MDKPRRVPQQKRAREKYEAVLDACGIILKENGVAKATLLEISLEAEVAIPTIYQYFPSKNVIFDTWIDRTIDNLANNISVENPTLNSAAPQEVMPYLLNTSLIAIQQIAPSLKNLLQNYPHDAVVKFIENTEKKLTIQIFDFLSGIGIKLSTSTLAPKIQFVTKIIIRYLMQIVMNNEEVNLEQLTEELTTLLDTHLNS